MPKAKEQTKIMEIGITMPENIFCLALEFFLEYTINKTTETKIQTKIENTIIASRKSNLPPPPQI